MSGPLVAQACATSVACLAAACAELEADAEALPLVVTTDPTSNGPLLVYPRSQGMGGSLMTDHWYSTASLPIRTPARPWLRLPRRSRATAR
ncbi:MAG: hypothetical protein ABIQ33_02800 [Caldimonas sp.]